MRLEFASSSTSSRARPGPTPLAQLQWAFKMTEFDAKAQSAGRDRRSRQQPAQRAGDAASASTTGPQPSPRRRRRGDRDRRDPVPLGSCTVDADGWVTRSPDFAPGMRLASLSPRAGVAERTPRERLLHHSASASAPRPAVQPRWKMASCVDESKVGGCHRADPHVVDRTVSLPVQTKHGSLNTGGHIQTYVIDLLTLCQKQRTRYRGCSQYGDLIVFTKRTVN